MVLWLKQNVILRKAMTSRLKVFTGGKRSFYMFRQERIRARTSELFMRKTPMFFISVNPLG